MMGDGGWEEQVKYGEVIILEENAIRHEHAVDIPHASACILPDQTASPDPPFIPPDRSLLHTNMYIRWKKDI